MDGIKKINRNEFSIIEAKHPFDGRLLAKDYFITIILYLIKEIKGIYFKGGTAIQKVILNHTRLSEDIDLTLTRNINDIKEEIIRIINDSNIFDKITQDKDVEGFTRLVLHYKNFYNEQDVIFIDLNERLKLILEPENYEIKHFYDNFIPNFKFPCEKIEEMIAGKMSAAIGRNKTRDHYDIYRLIKAGYTFNLKLVDKKCKNSNQEFSIIKMFNNANKLHKRWNEDMIPLLVEEVSFIEVMRTLADYFNLKKEKESLKC
ncbi:MAG: nucleotidyl transferase AbiEii/AbiGii toxin family protein [Candidatus Woesearchaeota archaeon]